MDFLRKEGLYGRLIPFHGGYVVLFGPFDREDIPIKGFEKAQQCYCWRKKRGEPTKTGEWFEALAPNYIPRYAGCDIVASYDILWLKTVDGKVFLAIEVPHRIEIAIRELKVLNYGLQSAWEVAMEMEAWGLHNGLMEWPGNKD